MGESKEKTKVEKASEVAEEVESATDSAEKKPFKIDYKNFIILVLDYLLIIASYITAVLLLIETDYDLSALDYLFNIIRVTPFYALLTALLFFAFRLYLTDYTKMGIKEVRRMIIASFISIIGYAIVMNVVMGNDFPHVFFVVGGMLQFLLTMLIRCFRRLITVSKDDSLVKHGHVNIEVHKEKKGFTLVELLIAIAIMAILSAMIAPAVIRYIEKSRKAVDVNTGELIYDAANYALSSGEDGVYESWMNTASNESAAQFTDSLTGHKLRPVAWARGVQVGNWENSLYKCAHNGAGEQPFVDQLLDALAQDQAKGKGNTWVKGKANAYDGKSECLTPLKYGKEMNGHKPECYIVCRDTVTQEPVIYVGIKPSGGSLQALWRLYPDPCDEYK